jgi:hypothetical protein
MTLGARRNGACLDWKVRTLMFLVARQTCYSRLLVCSCIGRMKFLRRMASNTCVLDRLIEGVAGSASIAVFALSYGAALDI